MNTQYFSDPQAYYLDSLNEIVGKLIKFSRDGDYVYRGEPKIYSTISSTLYRLGPATFDSGEFKLGQVQERIVDHVKRYVIAYAGLEDFDILTKLQHYGSQTNLVDFTTDFNIALFFACDGSHDKDGRVLLLNRTEETVEKYQIKKPQSPQNRILTQKSIFAQPPKGYIESTDVTEVLVPSRLKQWILIHLSRFQDISFQSIYNDLFGYIRYRALTSSDEANLSHFLAMDAKRFALNKATGKERTEQLQHAVRHFTDAIQYTPYDALMYVEQGECFIKLCEFDRAIETFSKAILLMPDFVDAYRRRAHAYLSEHQIESAIADCSKVIEIEPNNGRNYYDRGVVSLLRKDWKKVKRDLEIAREKGTDVTAVFKGSNMWPEYYTQLKSSNLPTDIASILEGESPSP